MHKFIALLALLFFTVAAEARIVTGTWTNATTDTTGAPLATSGPGALASTRMEWSLCSAPGIFGTLLGATTTAVTAPGAVQSSATPNLAPGVYCFRTQHLTVDGTASAFTATIQVTIQTPSPRPPSNFTVT